jgi:hypothetical protein
MGVIMSDIRAYKCDTCGAKDCRLYREYQTFLNHQTLYCTACALTLHNAVRAKEDKPVETLEQLRIYSPKVSQIGWRVAAVPCTRLPDGKFDWEGSFWGFTSVPDDGCAWWDGLPVSPPGVRAT